MEPFQVRLNCVDHYQAIPSEFDPPLPYSRAARKFDRSNVPVIRIFGTTETGQKICVHVHGAFPYLYVAYDGGLHLEEVRCAIQNLHNSVDHALAVSYRRNAYDKKAAFVAHITLVKGVPFYGYHVGYRFFFKIYLLNPIYTARLADLLLQGAVMKRPLQPYESHLQYISQWMCDYNLYGCAFMKCTKVKFRSPIPEYLDLAEFSHRWHDESIQPDCVSDEAVLPKQSHCPLEADVCVQDIINRLEIKERSIHQDFGELLRPIALSERLVPSMAGLWQDEKRRRKKRLGLLDLESTPFSTEDLASLSANPRNSAKEGWIHEQEYRELVQQIAASEKLQNCDQKVTFNELIPENPLEKDFKTALESVEDFFPHKNGYPNLALHHNEDADDMQGDVEDYTDENVAYPIESDEDLSFSSGDDMDLFSEEENHDEFINEVDNNPPSFGNGDHVVRTNPDEAQQEQRKTRNSYKISLGLQQKSACTSVVEAQDMTNSEKRLRGRRIADTESRKKLKHTVGNPPLAARRLFESREEAAQGAKSNMEGEASTGSHNLDAIPIPNRGKRPSSQSTIRPKASAQNNTLTFPVVKNPNDPMTILRFSQESVPLKQNLARVDNPATNTKWSDGTPSQSFSAETDFDLSNMVASEMAALMYDAFNFPPETRLFYFRRPCPNPSEVASTLHLYSYPSIIYQQAHYSKESDVPDRPRDYAGREFRLEGSSIHYLPDFDPSGRSSAMWAGQTGESRSRDNWQGLDDQLRESSASRVWEFAPVPPSRSEVASWFRNTQLKSLNQAAQLKKKRVAVKAKAKALSQIEGPTQKNDYGFKYSQGGQYTSVEHHAQYMSVMSLEIHVNTRGVLLPNPDEDEITSIFWCISSEDDQPDANGSIPGVHVGVVLQGEDEKPYLQASKAIKVEWEHEPSELDLINRLIDIVRFHDPDIIAGYEVHNSSWGYIIHRAKKKYDFDICDELSRVKSQSHGRFGREADRWGFNHTSSIRITGRHMINIWRAMRNELNLLQYSMENVVFHLLHRRIPHYSFRDLTTWYQSGKPRDILKVIDYYVSRIQMNIEILESNELIPRTSEQARLLGIDFFSVFSRGSQFKVESLMFRIAKPENFLLVSPSKKQVGQQNALECLPLVMEPQSDFYTSPLLVLDFQSLYPSIMIAYNYCYSTFLGRVQSWRGRDKMGFTDYKRQPGLLELLEDKVNVAPNGMIYAKPEVRKSLLARMLSEILETRIMVKSGMKTDKDDKVLQRLLNNRQLALKLIANVTYGYTSASFSGRMPCSEIADSIVQSGRETLEKAIAFIHSVERWDAEVVYGDTDSLFVYLKGRTREEAFDIGEEIAEAVTNINPHPVKLKFEKVYHPCVLLAKKRYVGFKYEHRGQKEPEFDAKGIETVRRDGTPAEQKIEEKALKLLFRTADLSQVKSYFQSQCSKIMQGRVSIQDFCFARAVKLGTYNDKGLLPAGALISTKRMLEDPRAEPQYGERVPYVVVTGAPGARLIDRCVPPETLLRDAQLELDAEYYITKNIIPPLERIFNLVGANVRQWYDEMPKFHRIRRVGGTNPVIGKAGKKTLESYMKSSACIVCKAKLYDSEIPICSKCMQQSHVSLLHLVSRQHHAEKKVLDLDSVCRSCMGVPFGEEVKCDSLDCPVFYSRTRNLAHWRHANAAYGPVVNVLQEKCTNVLEW